MRSLANLAPLMTITCVGLAVSLSSLPPLATPAASAASNTAGQFHEVALQGFGDPNNSEAWSAAWYSNKLYVGTNRDLNCLAPPPAHYPPPTPCPPSTADLTSTLGGQIWALDPTMTYTRPLTQSDWTQVFSSPVSVPITIAGVATIGPRDLGFRGMSVYTETDGTPSLYVGGAGLAGLAGPSAMPPSLLRSADGVTFQAVPADPGTTMGDLTSLTTTIPGLSSIRGEASFNGHLFVTVGTPRGSGALFSSADPQLGDNSFQQITPPTMTVYEIQPFNGHLYLGMAGPNGYSVYQTDCTAPPLGALWCPMSSFTQVVPLGGGLTSGANQSVTSMAVFTDTTPYTDSQGNVYPGTPHLYVGCAADISTNPVAAELVRVNLDDSWDVVVGAPRTVNGVTKNPLSGLGAGFGWPYNMHMWRMAVHQGLLYVGTFDAATHIFVGTPQQAQLQARLGFDLWATADGVHFSPITLNGFNDMFNEGDRALISTPYGLFVGTFNPLYGLRVYQGSIPPSALDAAPQAVHSERASDGAPVVRWSAPAPEQLYHVYRAQVTLETVGTGTAPVWLPGDFHEIGTTEATWFVDRGLPAAARAQYYVVAEDATGARSMPSNVTSTLSLAP